jgi:hypothetical protein
VCTIPESDESLTLMTVIYKEIPNIFQTQEIKFQKDNGNGIKHMRRINLSLIAQQFYHTEASIRQDIL